MTSLEETTEHLTDQELIDRYIDDNPPFESPERARVNETGVPVAALIMYWEGIPDIQEVARAYDLTPIAVEAALAYYARHRDLIDARNLLDRSAFFSRS